MYKIIKISFIIILFSYKLSGQNIFIEAEQKRNYNFIIERQNQFIKDSLPNDFIIRYFVSPEDGYEYGFQITKNNINDYKIFVFYIKNYKIIHCDVDSLVALKIDFLFRIIDSLYKNNTFSSYGFEDTYLIQRKFNNSVKTIMLNIDDEYLTSVIDFCRYLINYATGKDIDMDYIIKRIDELIFKME